MTGGDVRALRERLHLSQEALAQILQIAVVTVYRWERDPAKKVRASGGVWAFLYALDGASRRDTELIRHHMPDWRDRGVIYFWAQIFKLAHEQMTSAKQGQTLKET